MPRGRKKIEKPEIEFESVATEETSSSLLIKDAAIHPYYIRVESNCFILSKEGTALMEGCYSELKNAIKAIVKRKMAADADVVSLNQFLVRYETLTNQLLDAIKV